MPQQLQPFTPSARRWMFLAAAAVIAVAASMALSATGREPAGDRAAPAPPRAVPVAAATAASPISPTVLAAARSSDCIDLSAEDVRYLRWLHAFEQARAGRLATRERALRAAAGAGKSSGRRYWDDRMVALDAIASAAGEDVVAFQQERRVPPPDCGAVAAGYGVFLQAVMSACRLQAMPEERWRQSRMTGEEIRILTGGTGAGELTVDDSGGEVQVENAALQANALLHALLRGRRNVPADLKAFRICSPGLQMAWSPTNAAR